MGEQSWPVSFALQEPGIVTAQGQPRNSLLTRIRISTSTLVRETVLPSQPDNVTADLLSPHSTATKGDSSSSLSGPSTSSPLHVESRQTARADAYQPNYQELFRTQPLGQPSDVSALAGLDFESFLAGVKTEVDKTVPDQGSCITLPCQNGKQKSSQVREGADVVELLFDSRFTIGDPSNSFLQDSTSKYSSPWSSNAASTKLLDRIEADLPPMPIHRRPSSTNCLNLPPDCNGHRIPSTQTEIDIEPWLEVLTDYQDKVWGELPPLVEEAHEEIRGVWAEGATKLSTYAVLRRLGLILGHIQPQQTLCKHYSKHAVPTEWS